MLEMFVVVVLGCSDDLRECDRIMVASQEAASVEQCVSGSLVREDVQIAEYPTVVVDCRPASDLVARNKPGLVPVQVSAHFPNR